jgi:hypothetical protein
MNQALNPIFGPQLKRLPEQALEALFRQALPRRNQAVITKRGGEECRSG